MSLMGLPTIDYNKVVAWGTLLSGLGTFIVALVGTILVTIDIRIRKRELREKRARSFASLNVELKARMLPHPPTTVDAGGFWLLETRVDLKNVSHEALSIPAVYLSIRPLPESEHGLVPGTSFDLRSQSALKPEEEIWTPLNVARWENSIAELSPDETDTYSRCYVLDGEFIRNNPAIIINVEIFTASYELLKVKAETSDEEGCRRMEWLDVMNGEGHQDLRRHQSIAFDRTGVELAKGKIPAGARIFLNPEDGTPDIAHSTKFRDVLDSMAQYTFNQIVPLADSESFSARRPLPTVVAAK